MLEYKIPSHRGIFLGFQSKSHKKNAILGTKVNPGLHENLIRVFGRIVDPGTPLPLITSHLPFFGCSGSTQSTN